MSKARKQLAQITNYHTEAYYLRRMLTLAENVFTYDNLPEYIDVAYLNKQLVRQGSIAFFKDEILGVLALPYTNIGALDVYGRPTTIMVMGLNGYNKTLRPDEYVILYDNNGRYPIFLDIVGLAKRLSIVTRTIDVNVAQQRTPRIWKTTSNKKTSLEALLNEIDSFDEKVTGYENLYDDDVETVLSPAPYVTDKLSTYKDILWSEFLSLIGIANLSIQKGERLIKDEVRASFGSTIASRYSRFDPREKALKEINNKFGTNIQVSYYDDLPTTLETEGDEVNESLSISRISNNAF